MKKFILITLSVSIFSNAISQQKLGPIKLTPDSFDIGVLKSVILGNYELFHRHKLLFLKCYKEPYAPKKIQIQNSKEIAYIEMLPKNPSIPFICNIDVRQKINRIDGNYCVSVNTKEVFITNRFKFRIGDTYNSVINKLYNTSHRIDSIDNKKTIKILKILQGRGYYFQDDNLYYEAEYIFISNKLSQYILSIRI